MSRGRAEILLRDIEQTCDFLDSLDKTTIDVLQE